MDEVAALREQLDTTLATLEQSMEGLADAAPGAKKEEGGRRQTIKKKPPSRTESLASSAATAGGRPRPLGCRQASRQAARTGNADHVYLS